MRVSILRDCKHTGVLKGEIYKAKPFWQDPSNKVELLERMPDGFDPCCTEYRYNIKILRETL